MRGLQLTSSEPGANGGKGCGAIRDVGVPLGESVVGGRKSCGSPMQEEGLKGAEQLWEPSRKRKSCWGGRAPCLGQAALLFYGIFVWGVGALTLYSAWELCIPSGSIV